MAVKIFMQSDADVGHLHILTDAELQKIKDDVKKGYERSYPEIIGRKLKKKYGLTDANSWVGNIDNLLHALYKKGAADVASSKVLE